MPACAAMYTYVVRSEAAMTAVRVSTSAAECRAVRGSSKMTGCLAEHQSVGTARETRYR